MPISDSLGLSLSVLQQSTSTHFEELTSEIHDSSKKQVVLVETISDSLGVLKRSPTVKTLTQAFIMHLHFAGEDPV